MLDISDIKMISVIAQEGSINKASEQLNLSQPTVSKRLSRIEHKLGLELFYRDSNGMIPTMAAEYLQTAATGLESQLSAVARQVKLMSEKSGGHVSVGVGPIVEQRFIPKVLLDFAESHQKFAIHIHVDSSQNLLRSLRNGDIDIAIGPFSETECTADIKEVLQHSEPISCIMRQGHPLAGSEEELAFSEIKECKLITGTMPTSIEEEIDTVTSLELNPNIVYNSYPMAKTIIGNSDYITIGPSSIFHREIINEELVTRPLESRPLWTCRCFVKPEVECIPIVKEVIAYFSQYMKNSDRSA